MDHIEKSKRATLSLVRYECESNTIKEIGSGFFLKYKNNVFFLSAMHLFYDKTDKMGWYIQVDFDENKGTVLRPIGGLNFLLKISGEKNIKKLTENVLHPKLINVLRGSGAKSLEFCYKKMDYIQTYAIEADADFELQKKAQIIVSDNLENIPQPDQRFTFSGTVKPKVPVSHMDSMKGFKFPIHNITLVNYSGLIYKSRSEDDNMLTFELPQKIDVDFVRGCSGAPIFNDKGDLVSILVECYSKKGSYSKNGKIIQNQNITIFKGIDLVKLKAALDVENETLQHENK